MAYPDTQGGEDLLPSGTESQPSSKPPNGEEEIYLTVAQDGEGLQSLTGLCWQGWRVEPYFVLCCLVGVEWLLTQEFTFLLPGGFPGLLDKDSSLFLGFVICVHLVFLGCSLFQHLIWANEGKRKSREPSVMQLPGSQSPQAVCLLLSFRISCLFYTKCPRIFFLDVQQEKQGEKRLLHISGRKG